MFTATWFQVATYLLGICPFSIAFLVFLNSSVSFVVTDLIHLEHGIGDAVGTLGFADELLALIACPLWGLLSDRIGVRPVCVAAYLLLALALAVFVQCKNIYPQLLLGRLLFSLGAAAASTMVTAVLPAMSVNAARDQHEAEIVEDGDGRSSDHRERNASITQEPGSPLGPPLSVSSERTITPASYQSRLAPNVSQGRDNASSDHDVIKSSSSIAGYVGVSSGCGALLALTIFLPLPERFQKNGDSPEAALKYSYYVVAAVAFLISMWCLIGLKGLREEGSQSITTFKQLWSSQKSDTIDESTQFKKLWNDFQRAILLGFQRIDIGLAYVGGFVARASSVGISLFVPLLVNALFNASRLCAGHAEGTIGGLPDLKRECSQAYVLAAELTGVSQLIALLCAPVFGYASGRRAWRQGPLILASCAGVVGYILLATRSIIDTGQQKANAMAFLSMFLIGVSQIGAIVCSLGFLGDGVLKQDKIQVPDTSPLSAPETEANGHDGQNEHTESTPLMKKASKEGTRDLFQLKGSVAGVYSLYGGAGILLLTKLGGFLFDRVSFAAPFYMMAIFNAILLLFCVLSGVRSSFATTQLR